MAVQAMQGPLGQGVWGQHVPQPRSALGAGRRPLCAGASVSASIGQGRTVAVAINFSEQNLTAGRAKIAGQGDGFSVSHGDRFCLADQVSSAATWAFHIVPFEVQADER